MCLGRHRTAVGASTTRSRLFSLLEATENVVCHRFEVAFYFMEADNSECVKINGKAVNKTTRKTTQKYDKRTYVKDASK